MPSLIVGGMRRRTAPLIVVASLVLTAVASLSAPAEAAGVEIVLGASVQPKDVSVAKGTAVTFRNADSARHRVRTTDGPASIDSENLEPGDSFTITLTAAGTYRYVDDRNRDNRAYWGTITVDAGASAPGQTAPPPADAPASGAPAGTPPGTAAPAEPAPTSPAAPSTATVSIANRAFAPATVRIAVGGTVSWANDDDRAHTVTARDGSFDSGLLNVGGRFQRSFPTAGTFTYQCNVHPEMQGTVEVVAQNGTAPSASSGPASQPSGSGGGTPPPGAATAPTVAEGTASPSTTTGSKATGSATPAASRVTIVDFAFDPGTVTVATGGSVTWKNGGSAPHTVSAADGSFDSGIVQPGATFSTRFPKAGLYTYQCNIHPQMRGVVRVVDNSGAGGGAAPGGGAGAAADDGGGAGAPDGAGSTDAAAGAAPGRDATTGDAARTPAPGGSPAPASTPMVPVGAASAAGGAALASAVAGRRRLLALIGR